MSNYFRLIMTFVCGAALCLVFSCAAAAEEQTGEEEFPFTAEVTGAGINLRTDSTTASEIICSLDKGTVLEVVSGHYGWYKVRLPGCVCAYIREDMVSPVETRTANFSPREISGPRFNTLKVERDRVNIRLRPDESSPILGRVSRNEVLNFTGMKNNWYRIKPPAGSHGWIHANFVRKAAVKPVPEQEEVSLQTESSPEGTGAAENTPAAGEEKAVEERTDGSSVYEGIIKPYGMVFKRRATHKLVTAGGKILLLKGDRQSLNALVNRKARVTGKSETTYAGYPLVEIVKIEAVD